jgi:acetylornithine deacetylase
LSDRRAETIAILERLVAFDTTSVKTNIPCIDYVKGYLAGHGIESHLVPTPDRQKASLFATIGDGSTPGIGLSGHTDVVPVTGQEWATDPFKLTERDGKLYGRGSCDMKGFLACVMAMVPQLKRRKLGVPVHIIFSYDEEVGCTGVRPMIAELGSRLTKPRLVIVGEPTTMTVVDAHKGATRFKTTVTGREAHSSMAHIGVNAIHIAGLLIAELGKLEAELRNGVQDKRFTPPYSTLQVGLIEGGRAQNIVPKHCSFSWEMRVLPSASIDATVKRFNAAVEDVHLPAMRRVAVDATIETVHMNTVPAFYSGAGSEAVSLALRLAGQNETFAVSYGTEAGLFQAAGPPCVICGPGDIEQAHRPDEFVAIAELARCLAFLERLADHATAA